MAALTADRNTAGKTLGRRISVKVVTGVTIFAGSLVMAVDASGLARAAAVGVAGDKILGRAEESIANAAAGAEIKVQKGVFKWNNGATPVVQATVGDSCFAEDDQTVGITALNAPTVGTVDSIDPDGGVWVATL